MVVHKRSWFVWLAVCALANMLLFFVVQIMFSKQYIFADRQELKGWLQSESSSEGGNSLQQTMALQEQVIDVIASQKKSVVSLMITKDLDVFLENPQKYFERESVGTQSMKLGGGSGIIVTKDGLVLTNKHVVADVQAKYSVVDANGVSYDVLKVWRDPNRDIAVIQLDMNNKEQDLQVARFVSEKEDVRVGQFVLALGNSLSQDDSSVSFGIVSGKNRTIATQGTDVYEGLYQTDAAIYPGNSGGPLMDMNGHVIALSTALDEADGMWFALPLTQEAVDGMVATIREYNSLVR